MTEKIKKKEEILGKKDILDIVNKIAEEINYILNQKKKEKYFYAIVLLYSFIENLLRHICFIDTMWKQAGEGEISNEVCWELREYYIEKMNFYEIIEKAYNKKLIGSDLKEKLHKLRKKRNDFVHQCWLYTHRDNERYLKKELTEITRVANSLVGQLNQMEDQMGVLELYRP